MSKLKRFFCVLGRALYIIAIRWGLLAFAAVFLTWYLQYRVSGNDPDAAWTFWDEKPLLFWYSALVILCLTAVAYGLFHRPFCSIGLMFALITIITYISTTKVSFRGTPLLPEDFQLTDQAGTLTKFIDVGVLTRTIIASVLAIALGFLLDYLTYAKLRILPALPKIPPRRKKSKAVKAARCKSIALRIVYALAPRILITAAVIFALVASTSFIIHRKGGSQEELPALNTSITAWNQATNYEENGFLIGFLSNFNKATIEEPEDYSESKIAEIKSTYESSAEKSNTDKTALKDADYNIVIVLNESFYDLSFIETDYPFAGPDIIPNFHKIMRSYPSGYLYSTDYGGGTANIEFEADTGLSNYWAQTVPYTDILPKLNDLVSIAKEAKSSGYNTTAIHSFAKGMYKRDLALKIEGFDTFISQEDMKHTEHDGKSDYINDRSIYQETLDVLKSSDQKQLVSVITMQNHAPYLKSNYEDSEYLFEVLNYDHEPVFRDALLAYIQSVHSADTYMGEFIDELSKLDEKTVVLFYGDHAPGLFSYAHTLQTKEIADLTQLTPYFIWSNFEIDDDFSSKDYGKDFLATFGGAYATSDADGQTDAVADVSKFVTLPTTTPNCLTSSLYGVLGLKRNAEMELLEQVCAETPILTQLYLEKNTPDGEATQDYKLLNYDLLFGEQYWLK